MKWAIIGLLGLVVLGGVGYGVYRWTDLPEQGQEWMDEQDLKNFPTQARRELADMRKDLEEKKEVKRDLEKDIIAREGREDWDEATLKSETKGLATVVWYEREVKRFETGIESLVTQVKEERAELEATGTVDAETGKIPADHEYTVTNPSGKTVKLTEAQARKQTDAAAKEINKIKRKIELQKRVISKKKDYVTKLDTLIVKMGEKIDEMEVFIEEMEVEIELLELEENIAEVNEAINGGGSDNKFGKAINKFRTKQKEFLAEQELAEKDAPDENSFFSDDSTDTKEDGASASYWN
ncbi:MAG: hypothetical protein KDB68_06240 [Planctomycetes bacterium]|nr:hypothetical protein [Planctomycetota bacterium]MCA8935788.1 hypothetical protein [Planctomycetota bacterium]MCA8946514.1 hypothetical protein [Planctomycetota bacterium]